jgi:hypothetical protein
VSHCYLGNEVCTLVVKTLFEQPYCKLACVPLHKPVLENGCMPLDPLLSMALTWSMRIDRFNDVIEGVIG